MRKFVSIVLALPFLIGAAPPPDATRSDVRCLVLSLPLAGSDKPEEKQAGLVDVFYFLGRIDGRSPGFDLETAVVREETAIRASAPADRQALAQSCASILEKRGGDLKTLGDHLQARGL
ncbi:MAG TPA: hypothetical protein VFW19_12955 [Allosphingosinicella sp.]|nr:hypothetical protein [Allosphingosinicella sp.]